MFSASFKTAAFHVALCLSVTAAAAGVAAAHPAKVYASTPEVQKVITSRNGQTHSYYVAGSPSADEVKDNVETCLEKENTDENTTDVNAEVKDGSIQVQPAASDAAEEAGTLAEVSEKIVDDQAVDAKTICKQNKVTQVIPYKTVVKKTRHMRKTTKKVTGGKTGKVVASVEITRKVGEPEEQRMLGEKTVEPKDKVVTKGTGSVAVGSGKTFSGTSGKQIVNYAENFVGNPYRWGGTSLTNGCDCSGFIYSVYRHFGLNVNRIPSYNGKAVSLRNLKPGDIVKYPGHFAMYAGNGKVVHAANYQYGIIVTPLNWGKHARAARRIVK
jgi:cell wall-associated NlpC family hydrolase